MSTITAYGRQLAARLRALPPVAVDVVIMLACLAMAVIMIVTGDQPRWWYFALAAANALPLLWRRRFPILVTAVVGVGTTWLAVVGALGDFPAAQLVATYTFAALSPPARRVLGALGTAGGITMSIMIPGEALLAFAPTVIMFVTAYALGAGARARREALAERARRMVEEQDAAAARERERIAREMHDILAHSMGLVIVQAEAGPVATRTDPDKAEEIFDTIAGAARQALGQLRRTLGALRAGEQTTQPQPSLEDLPPLVDSVRRTGLEVTLEQHGQPPAVPADLAAAAYRILQESLTNVLRHAAAGRAWVRLDWREHMLELQVRDDGASPGNGSGGRGIAGMRERAAAAGGALTAGPHPDGVGFQVAARLPLP